MMRLRGFTRVNSGISLWLILVFAVEFVSIASFGIVIAPTETVAAVVTVDPTPSTNRRSFNNTGSQTVFTDDQTGYAFYRDVTGQCVYRKSTDAGATWGSSIIVDSQTDCLRISVWYDQWTPGGAGSSIHIATMDSSVDAIFYNELDTSTDTLLNGATPTNTSVNSGQVPTLTVTVNTHAITKATDGEIYITTNDNSDSYVVSCTASCDTESAWSEVGVSPFDFRNDHNILVPLAGGEVMVINRDISANLIRSKIWDGVSWSAAWTTIDSSVPENAEYDGGMSATVDLSNGHVYVAYVTDHTIIGGDDDDIQVAVYDGSAWTRMADVLTNVAGRGILDAAIAIDQNNSHVYVAYTIQDTATDATTANVYYKESTDGMTSWGSEVGPINATAGEFRKPAVDPSNFERLYVTWWDNIVDDFFGETLDNIGPDTTISATNTAATTVRSNTPDVFLEGTLVIESLLANTLSAVTITETGTINASTGLANIKLFYDLDTTAPYNCVDESYDGTEPQFGATDTDGFSGENGSSTFSGAAVLLNPNTTFCGYVAADVTSLALDADEVLLQITDPVTDVVITGTDPYPDQAVPFTGTTTIASSDLTLTHYHWRNDDGSETAATSATLGSEDVPITTLAKETPVRLRTQVSVEGSTSTDAIQYQLEFTQAVGSCTDSTGWIAVDSATDEFAMFDSVNLTNNTDTTNIALALGGVTDENTFFVTPNGGVQDIGDTTDAITLETNEFIELEYSIEATASAVEGTTYCFRVTDVGTPLSVYDVLPQVTINADIVASSSGSHVTTVDVHTPDAYLGGSFSLQANGSDQTVTDVTITETGTINASSGLANIKLFYDLDTTAPYNCVDESYDGTEPQFGATDTDGFSDENGSSTFSGTQLITATQSVCLYVVSDITATAMSGETIQYSIASAVDDVVAGGASVSPSASVGIVGSTTVLGVILTQTHYHWRSDDGTETGATSETGGNEDRDVVDWQLDSPLRLRLAVSNEGATTSAETVYVLEYAEQVTTCSAAVGWTPVDDLDDAWNEFDSTFLSHEEDTTNIAVSAGGVSDENTTFVGTAGVRETDARSASTSLTENEFIELEFSLTSTLATEFDTTYCFRVSANGDDLPVYNQYAELTMAAKRDFKVQRGTVIITGTASTVTAGIDYDPPAAGNTAFIRITNTHHTGAGDIVNGAAQDVQEVTAYIQNPENIDTSITFARDANINETFINWEIVEFIGQAGTDNEMIVRSNDTITMNAAQTTITGPTVTVDDDADVVVFITGLSGNDTGNDFFSTQVTAEWDAANDQPIFTRAAAAGADVDISYAIIEYTGRNWKVQRVEHTYTAAGTVETEAITPVAGLSQVFIHAQKRVGANSQVASYGHEVYLTSMGVVSFELNSNADMAVPHVSVAWIIENVQTGVGAMQVERQAGTTRLGSEPLTLALGLSTLDAVGNSSIFGNSAGAGANNAHPRAIAGLMIVSDSNYELWRSDTGADLFYRTEIVQWPIADLSYRQNYYRIYTNNNQQTPTDAWPMGAEDLGENTSITAADDPPGQGDVLRLRMTVQARNANWPENFVQFKLQYAERVTTCTAIVTWTDVGSAASGEIWRGFAATGTIDGTDLSSDPPTPGDLLISVSDVAGTLEHENNTATNTYIAFDGEDVEYDWHVEHNGAAADTTYCFRMVEADGSDLSGYLQYPEVRTADFTPVIADWRWYDDPQNETPLNPLAAANVAPTDITSSTSLALRVVVPEDKSVDGNDVKFLLQWSEDPDFATAFNVTASSSCTLGSIWCYTDGAALDNATITTAIVGTADVCAAGVGPGCGTHNSAPAYVAGHPHNATESQEYSFTLQNTLLARPNVVYYFRLFDVGRASEVAVAEGSTYPTIVTEGASLLFTVSGLPSGTSTAGVATDATTTPAAVDFGSLPVGTDVIAAQRLSITTNAPEGYRVFKFASQPLANASGLTIPSVSSTNAVPDDWSTVCSGSETGCVGYHTTDATLGDGSARFAPLDTYAALHLTPEEVMFSSIPTSESHDMIYRINVSENQAAGQYETDIVYIATPVF